MSDYYAIGAVSATLQRLLRDRMEIPEGVSSVHVTVSTPGSDAENGQTLETPRVNLFLYKVTENGALKSQEIPGQGHPGSYGHPPLSLDLHYLLTAYGSTAEAEVDVVNETLAQYLLGSAMRVLHDHPIVTEKLTTIKDPSGEFILDQSLRGAHEQIKLSLDPVSLEALSDVWSALTLPYRLSAAYTVSVVQIESQQARIYPRLVGAPPEAGPQVAVVIFSSPTIDRVRIRRQEPPHEETTVPYARIGDTLVLLGSNLGGEDTGVQIGSLLIEPAVYDGQRLEVVISDNVALQPGAQTVSVVRNIMVGDPPEPRTGFCSNQAVFMLVPRVDTVVLDGSEVTITGSRLFQDNKDCQTIIGDAIVSSADYSSAVSDSISFPLPALDPGTYPVRVRVNAAESIDARTITLP
ncbi:MAG: DUF4255 domain-containing protein [Desulfobacterales bacterium]|nr:DUF4255 domain-containing protein [Desulfobacterales bacterium]